MQTQLQKCQVLHEMYPSKNANGYKHDEKKDRKSKKKKKD